MKLHAQIETIGPKENFYGYITGVGIEQNWNPENGSASRMYATFEYNEETIIWAVPDYELFSILTEFLRLMAFERSHSDSYGMQKLWICKQNGKWIVNLP